MTDIVKEELIRNVKELERCVEKIVSYTNTTEEIMKLKDPDERAEILEEAGLDPDDYDFD